jgi:hypothetical protein
MDQPYRIDIPGLATAVEACGVDARHRALSRVLSQFKPLEHAKFANRRGDRWLVLAKVLDKDGRLVADDHEAWLAQQVQQDGGVASRTLARLKDQGYVLTKCELESLIFVHDRGGSQSNFVQVHVDLETEYVDRPLFDTVWFSEPRELRDLVRQDASPFTDRRLYRPPAYRLRKLVDMPPFLDVANAAHERQRQAIRDHVVDVTELGHHGEPRRNYQATAASLDPEFEKFPWWRGQRLFNDWTLSSAGRSGARLCEHWVMDTSDHTDASGVRHVNFIPMWTHTFKMAKVERAPDIHALLSKLQSIDRRTGVPFAWFFYMLHGNRVQDAAGKAIHDGAERGEIDLPEHDYQVLRRWRVRPYGF